MFTLYTSYEQNQKHQKITEDCAKIAKISFWKQLNISKAGKVKYGGSIHSAVPTRFKEI